MHTGGRRRAWIWAGLAAVVVAGLVAVLWMVPQARGADGPYTTLPQACSLLDPATLGLSVDNGVPQGAPGLCRWNGDAISVALQVELASAGAGISAVDRGRRIFPIHGSNKVGLAGLADEAAEGISYEGSTSQASVIMRAANMMLVVSYQDDRAQPGYLAEVAEVLARQALRKAAGDAASSGSAGRPASTRSLDEVVRGKRPLDPAAARYQPQPSRAVAPPSWRPGDDTAVMGFFDEFAFKVPISTRCEFLGTHWQCSWPVPGESIAAISLSLQPCQTGCQGEWPFRAADWPAGQEVATQSFEKLEIDDVTYRNHVQTSMKRTTPRFHLNVQVVVPERHATTAQKIINDIRFQAA